MKKQDIKYLLYWYKNEIKIHNCINAILEKIVQ